MINGKKVNDRIMGIFVSIMNKRCELEKCTTVIGSSFALPAVRRSMILGNSSFTKHFKKLAEASIFILPTFVIPNHWILSVIDLNVSEVCIYDPLGQNNYTEIEEELMFLLEKKLNRNNFTVRYADNLTLQSNDVDCGVLAMKYVKCLVNGDSLKFNYSSSDLRRELVKDIKIGSEKVSKEVDDFKSTLLSLMRMTLSAPNNSTTQSDLDFNIAIAGLQYREPRTPGDGNCLFHAIADQLRIHNIRDISHQDLRRQVVNHLQQNPHTPDGTHLSSFVEDLTWDEYIQHMSTDTYWGDNLVLMTVAELYQADIFIVSSLPGNSLRQVSPSLQLTSRNNPGFLLGHLAECHYFSLISSELHDSLLADKNMKKNGKMSSQSIGATKTAKSQKKSER